MKGDKAATAAKSSPEWRSCRETKEGRQGGNGSQEQPRMDHAKRQMKGDKAATAAKSSPEWRSCRDTNEGRQGGSKAAVASQPFGDCGDQQPNL